MVDLLGRSNSVLSIAHRFASKVPYRYTKLIIHLEELHCTKCIMTNQNIHSPALYNFIKYVILRALAYFYVLKAASTHASS